MILTNLVINRLVQMERRWRLFLRENQQVAKRLANHEKETPSTTGIWRLALAVSGTVLDYL